MSLCGPVDGDPARQTAKLGLIHDDRLSRWAPASRIASGRRVQPPFGIQQVGFRAFELTAIQ
jgi:hypothetical protein